MFNDDYHGIGGSYIVDPDTGKRRPADQAEQTPAREAPALSDEDTPVKKTKGGN